MIPRHKMVSPSVGITSPPPGSPPGWLPPVWPHWYPCPDTGGWVTRSHPLPLAALLPQADPTTAAQAALRMWVSERTLEAPLPLTWWGKTLPHTQSLSLSLSVHPFLPPSFSL